jgi:hypothetical protein
MMTTENKRETYCRVCGKNKGHNFSSCKNFSGMRQIINSQDEEYKSVVSRLGTAEEQAKLSEGRRSDLVFTSRIISALLTLVEAKRNA